MKPLEEPEDDEQGWVEVYWQGDPARRTEVQGDLLANIAVAQYASLHAIPVGNDTKARYAHLAQHFTFKTGQSLILKDGEQDDVLFGLVSTAAKIVGKEALIELLKKNMGL